MKQFCNKKREREEIEDESLTNPNPNKKVKTLDFTIPQKLGEINDFNNINISFADTNSINKLEKHSNSTLQSKIDQVIPEIKNPVVFKLINYNENQNPNQNKKNHNNKI